MLLLNIRVFFVRKVLDTYFSQNTVNSKIGPGLVQTSLRHSMGVQNHRSGAHNPYLPLLRKHPMRKAAAIQHTQIYTATKKDTCGSIYLSFLDSLVLGHVSYCSLLGIETNNFLQYYTVVVHNFLMASRPLAGRATPTTQLPGDFDVFLCFPDASQLIEPFLPLNESKGFFPDADCPFFSGKFRYMVHGTR